MTGNEWMFYLALVFLFILIAVYGSLRIWIEIRKRNVKRNIQESRVRKNEKE